MASIWWARFAYRLLIWLWREKIKPTLKSILTATPSRVPGLTWLSLFWPPDSGRAINRLTLIFLQRWWGLLSDCGNILTLILQCTSFCMLNLCELIMAQVKCVEVFKDFYQTKTKHRKLTWIYSLGTCNINGKFEQKTMELVVTTYQVNPQVPYCSFLRVKIAAFSHPPQKSAADVVWPLLSGLCAPALQCVRQVDLFWDHVPAEFDGWWRRQIAPLPFMRQVQDSQ